MPEATIVADNVKIMLIKVLNEIKWRKLALIASPEEMFLTTIAGTEQEIADLKIAVSAITTVHNVRVAEINLARSVAELRIIWAALVAVDLDLKGLSGAIGPSTIDEVIP